MLLAYWHKTFTCNRWTGHRCESLDHRQQAIGVGQPVKSDIFHQEQSRQWNEDRCTSQHITGKPSPSGPYAKGGYGGCNPPPLNLSKVKFSGSTFGSCTTDSTVFKFCTSMWLFSAWAPALYKGCGLLAAIIFFQAWIHGCTTLKVTKILLLISF